jgi:DNA-3-methyladenine glycosylase
MHNLILPTKFFNRPVLEVCPELLGKFLVREFEGNKISLMINEIEAYDGPLGLACHAAKGRTTRTEPLFGPAGHFYVYFVYGMYWMLNIVTGPVDYPAAILIRGAGNIRGPGKLTKSLKIDKAQNSRLAAATNGLWFEDQGVKIHKTDILKTPRIGVDYAGPIWSKKPYRFFLKQTPID